MPHYFNAINHFWLMTDTTLELLFLMVIISVTIITTVRTSQSMYTQIYVHIHRRPEA